MLDSAMVLSGLRFVNEMRVGAYNIQKIGYNPKSGQLVAFGRSSRDYVIGIGVFINCNDQFEWSYGHYHDEISDALDEFDILCSGVVWYS